MLPGPEGLKTHYKIYTNIGKKKLNLLSGTQAPRFKKYHIQTALPETKNEPKIPDRLKFKLSARSLPVQAAQTV